MCGLAGSSGILDNAKRARLTRALAHGIDYRGGHAAGYLSVSRKAIRYARSTGPFKAQPEAFMQGAAAGAAICLLHSRYATCGIRAVTEAHPFTIRRPDTNGVERTVLWGAHNGTIANHEESAEENGRRPSVVDSEEIFQLLADDDLDGVRDLQGYGAITWIEAHDPTRVKLCRISGSGDLEAASVVGGGLVWASTTYILKEAIKAAGLEIAAQYDLKAGRVYEVTGGEIFKSDITGLTVKSLWSGKGSTSYGSIYGAEGWDGDGYYCGSSGKKSYRWNPKTQKVEEYYPTRSATGDSDSTELVNATSGGLDGATSSAVESDESDESGLDYGWDELAAKDDDDGAESDPENEQQALEDEEAEWLADELSELDEKELQELIVDDGSPELWRALARLEAQERREQRASARRKRAEDERLEKIINQFSDPNGNLPKAVGSA